MVALKIALVTGGAGFIGHHLIEYILDNTDWNVVCLDRLDTSGNLNRLDEVVKPKDRKRFKFVFHDLKAEINSQLGKQIGKPHFIFHLAASSHVDRSIEDPLGYVMDNVVGTCNIYNFARQIDNIEYIVTFGTDEVFGNAQPNQYFSEDDRHKPKNPYAATKSAAEMLGIAYHNTFKLPIITTQCMNVIGERQHPEKFLPLCINRVLASETIYIHSYPNISRSGTRFYIHAKNVADVTLYLVTNAELGEVYNIVGQREVSNLELAQFIANELKLPLKYKMVDFHSNRPGHDLRYALKDTKLCKLNYQYPLNFEESLAQTIKWTLENKRWLCQ